MTEREQYLDYRIQHLHKMLKELVAERNELRKLRRDAYLDELETSCNPSRAEVMYRD